MTSSQASRCAIQAAAVVCAAICAGSAGAQQLIGYVKADDANVTGATDIMDGQAVLSGSVGVTAKDHTAVITLGRGGLARVCQTSALHMTQSKVADAGTSAPLLFSLDRGAIEIRMNGLANDSIMTPDLRMTVQASGPLDVRLRVARNGDTCVENHGGAAPSLAVSDPFGTSMYELMAGQHVLFEHGDLHEVVDHETEPCGCPDEKGASVADALLAPGGPKIGAKTATPPAATELQHPFPAAVSEGLAPTVPVQGAANPAQPQATAELRYNAPMESAQPAPGNSGGAAKTARKAPVASPPVVVASVPQAAATPSLGSAPPVAKEPAKTERAQNVSPDQSPKRDLAHIVGHFFKFLFGH
ncbi:MAG TPA: hypothetical protein VN612_08460 [Acidobacteriaceae bacterium]|nr:hypothetical protein [Acidobacteriaceae bacterium]